MGSTANPVAIMTEIEKADNRERQRRWYYRHHEDVLAMHKDRYHDRKLHGLCPTCGSPRSDARFVLCSRCRRRKVLLDRRMRREEHTADMRFPARYKRQKNREEYERYAS